MPTQYHQEVSQAIGAQRDAISDAVITLDYSQRPELLERYGERGRAFYRRDNNHHLDYLAQSIAVSQPALFTDYLAWAKVMLVGHGVQVGELAVNLERLRDVLQQILPEKISRLACEYVETGLHQLPTMSSALPSYLAPQQPLASLAHEYLAALLAGERQIASRLVLDAVQGGTSVQDIYLQVFQSCQHEIGRLWQMNRISVAQEHYCSAATQLIMSQLYSYLSAGARTGRTLVATCIAGDLHEIGVRMVSDLLELDGWDTFYLGANTPVPSIVGAVREQQADVLAISATITPHLRLVEELITQVRAAPDCGEVKILVGGYPFNVVPEMWGELGADGCAHDAATAVDLANRLVSNGEAVMKPSAAASAHGVVVLCDRQGAI
jgi:methanogenic corrinoid protein MtbC1